MSMAKALIQILAAIAAVLPAVIPAMSPDMGVTEWLNVAILAIGAYEVWNTNNSQFWPLGKSYASVAMTILIAINTLVIDGVFLEGGITGAELLQLIVAILAPIGVYVTRNSSANPAPV
jgi:uncharacterized membrane protein